MSKRASFEELLDFCNKVRRAGGGSVIEALMPGDPKEAKTCLVAKNLNFECAVDFLASYGNRWFMMVSTPELKDRIANALDLEIVPEDTQYGYGDDGPMYAVFLPPEIGQVAHDYDEWLDIDIDAPRLSKKEIEDYYTFLPYVDDLSLLYDNEL